MAELTGDVQDDELGGEPYDAAAGQPTAHARARRRTSCGRRSRAKRRSVISWRIARDEWRSFVGLARVTGRIGGRDRELRDAGRRHVRERRRARDNGRFSRLGSGELDGHSRRGHFGSCDSAPTCSTRPYQRLGAWRSDRTVDPPLAVATTCTSNSAHTPASPSPTAPSPPRRWRGTRARLGYTHLGITDTADLGGIAKFAVEAMSPLKDPMCANVERHEPDEPCRICHSAGAADRRRGARSSTDFRRRFIARTQRGLRESRRARHARARGPVERVGSRKSQAQAARPAEDHVGTRRRALRPDLHALTGPATGELASLLRAGKERRGRACSIGGARCSRTNRLSIEVQLHHTGGHEAALAAALIELAEEAGSAVGGDAGSALRRRRAAGSCTTCSPRCATISRSTTAPSADCCIRMASGGCCRPAKWPSDGRDAKRDCAKAVRIAEECD